MTRLLAYLLEFAEGIEFSRGVSDPDEPAIAIRDLTGAITTWIDIGTPDAARLHKASKSARPRRRLQPQGSRPVPEAACRREDSQSRELELYAIDRALVAALSGVSIGASRSASRSTSARLYVSIGADTLTGRVTRLNLP